MGTGVILILPSSLPSRAPSQGLGNQVALLTAMLASREEAWGKVSLAQQVLVFLARSNPDNPSLLPNIL